MCLQKRQIPNWKPLNNIDNGDDDDDDNNNNNNNINKNSWNLWIFFSSKW